MKKTWIAATLLAAAPTLAAAEGATGAGLPEASTSSVVASQDVDARAAEKAGVEVREAMARLVAQAPVGTAAEATSTASEPAADVTALVAKVQAFYEKSQGFDTRFVQRFVQGGMPSRLGGAGAEGRMRFRKPVGGSGPLMRWDYQDGRILLLVKDRSWTYDPDTQQATEYKVDPAQLSAAVTFMWGTGKLVDEFKISLADRNLGPEGVALELVPLAKSSFSKVFLLVDPASGRVGRSVVVQSNGSENDLSFHDAKVSTEVKAADFDPAKAFPAGTTRIKAAIPGQ